MTEHGSEPTRVNADRVTTPSTPSCPALCRVSTHLLAAPRTWMAGTSPAMTNHGRREAKLRRLARPGRRLLTGVPTSRRMRTPHSVSDAPLLNTVMPGLVPGIHVLARGTKARGWPGRRREAKLVASPGHDDVC